MPTFEILDVCPKTMRHAVEGMWMATMPCINVKKNKHSIPALDYQI